MVQVCTARGILRDERAAQVAKEVVANQLFDDRIGTSQGIMQVAAIVIAVDIERYIRSSVYEL